LSAARFAAIFTGKGKALQMADDPEKKLLEDLGHRIRSTRAEQGLSLEQLAQLTGSSAPALCTPREDYVDPEGAFAAASARIGVTRES